MTNPYEVSEIIAEARRERAAANARAEAAIREMAVVVHERDTIESAVAELAAEVTARTGIVGLHLASMVRELIAVHLQARRDLTTVTTERDEYGSGRAQG